MPLRSGLLETRLGLGTRFFGSAIPNFACLRGTRESSEVRVPVFQTVNYKSFEDKYGLRFQSSIGGMLRIFQAWKANLWHAPIWG